MVGQLEAPDGSLTDDSQDKAYLLNNYFVSVFQTEGPDKLPAFKDRQFASILTDVAITEEKISKTTDHTKPSNSQGPDKIHPMIIKECKTALLNSLKTIFEKSVNECKIPGISKLESVSAVFTSGTKLKPENYKPISLTSVPEKF